MAVITINGVPGSGKTTIAIELAKILHIEQIVQTDTIKDFFKINSMDPVSYCATHEAWKFIGDKNITNIINGFKMHTKFYENFLLRMIEISQHEGKKIIVEGMQITPEIFSRIETEEKYGFFLDIPSKKEHFIRFDLKNMRRTKNNNKWYENYDIISILNSFLKKECKKNNIVMINNTSFNETIRKMIETLHSIENKKCLQTAIM